MKSSFLIAALTLSALSSEAQLSRSSRLNESPPLNITGTSRPVDTRAVENLLGAYDAGDFYTGAAGRRSLLRLSGAVAVRTGTGKDLETLTAKGGVLEGYQRGTVSKEGFAWLKGTAAAAPGVQPKVQDQASPKIEATRRAENVSTANPVFVDPQSGLWAMTTDEIIVALKPGVEAEAYFGTDWPRVKPLAAPLGQYVLTLPSYESETVFAEVNRRSVDPRVAWAEPNFISQGLTHLVPNDAQFVNQWYLRNSGQSGGTAGADIKATAAWDRTVGSGSIIVAVLDIGFDLAHPDLIANIATNAQEIAGNGIDDDGNGYVDDVRGWDFFSNDNNPSPNTAFDNHGTAVAGAAIAAGNNGTGIAGVAYGCRLLPLRMGEATTEGSFSSRDTDIANALYYAAGGVNQTDGWRGADVIVMSFESFQAAVVDSALTFATEQGRGGRGCPAFVATGNHGDNWLSSTLNGFPAGTFTFEWKYAKNGSVAGGEDAVWMAQVTFPGGAMERFDGGVFPPAGWTTSGNANWTHASDPAHAYAASLLTARSGVIGDNQSSSLSTTRTIPAGSLNYLHWVSSEGGNDIFSISINGSLQTGANQSGAPFIRSGPSYPGTHTNVITVGASTHWDTRSSYSQIGGKIDFLAPGGGGGGAGVFSTDRTGTDGDNTAASPAGDYLSTQGTSLANPVAAGVGALMLSVAPNLTARQVRDILRSTADKIGPVPYTNGWNPYYGTGRINASNAVAQAYASSCLGVPILVTSLADSGLGTLRDAVDRANAAGCPAVISLAVTGVIHLASSLPAIIPSVTLSGPGTNRVTVDGGGANPLFHLGGATNKLSGLRLANAFSGNAGSGVINLGRTVIENCAFSNCVTVQSFGGAVANFSEGSTLFVTNCIFVNNTVRGGAGEDRGAGGNGGPGGGGSGMGGAIYSEGAQLVLHGCGFTGNTAAGGNGGNGDGNGFSNDSGGNGGFPNNGMGGAPGQPGSPGGFGGGGGGGAGFGLGGYDGGAGGFGGGGGGGGARGGGGSGGIGGIGGSYGGGGGPALFSHSGGGGGGAGLGGAVFTRTGAVTMIQCTFTGNRATNGIGGAGSFGAGIGGGGQGAGGAIFTLDAKVTAQNLTFNGNGASTGSSDVDFPTTVTTLADDGPGSLRRAIDNAAVSPGPDVITFAPNLSGGTIRLTTSELVISNLSATLLITATNLPLGVAISGENARRAFSVANGNALVLDSLTLSNCTSGAQDGGAVLSAGNLALVRCLLTHNSAPLANGGAVANVLSGTLSVNRCTFAGNGAKGSGGALSSAGALTTVASTFAGNIVTNGDAGAIYATGAAAILHSTIVSNAGAAVGGMVLQGTPTTLSHCVIAGNAGSQAADMVKGAGAYSTAEFNFVGNGISSRLTNGVDGNQIGTAGAPLNPLLGPLQNYGGPTPTMHPLPGSPVIEAGNPAFSGAGLSDQRGWPRVSLARVDIGAVEYAPAAGLSVRFDGVNGFLILSNAALDLPTNEITVELWERVETVRDQFSFILFPDVAADRMGFSPVRANSTTYWDFSDLFNGGRVAYATPPSTINQWTHWALVSTRAGNAMRIYRNGLLDASATTNRAFVRYAGALVLGARLDAAGQEYFKGEIDEFRIWSVARTAAEIQADMNSALCLPQENLWLYWKFNEPDGAVVLDYSGNGRNGLLFNGAARTVSLAPLLPAGVAQVVRVGPDQVRVSWAPDRGCLQSAPEVTGPWNSIPGATNGQIILTTPARQFFRVIQ